MLKQGCSTSSTLFKIYINDLIIDMNNADTDDVVIMSPTPEKLQHALDVVSQWSSKWRLRLNGSKTQIVHYRKQNVERCDKEFICGNLKLELININT